MVEREGAGGTTGATTDETLLKQAASRLAAAGRIAVLTGAGVSKESGIPTFRDALTGFWAQYDPEKLATPEGFLSDPALVWRWYDMRRKMVADVQPNPGHTAIARLAQLKPVQVITQNIDGLHEKAGSKDVLELHGNITRFYCFDKHHPAGEVPFGLTEPPKCTICGSLIRPAVVWFGEALPHAIFSKANAVVTSFTSDDVLLVVGTSGLVQPAASLPYWGKQNGATVIEVNPDTTPIGDLADIFLQGTSGKVLPELIRIVEQMR